MTRYAVIDTNVLVSALISSHDDAATVLVVGKLFSGEVIPLFLLIYFSPRKVSCLLHVRRKLPYDNHSIS
jgi:predicted nucleic acid-binding protein